VGYQAGYSQTTGSGTNSYFGFQAGYGVTTGAVNTFLGYNAGASITTGSKNTIIGAYGGNQGGLDIRTASNYIVLSDGDGNPRGIFDGSGNWILGNTTNASYGTVREYVESAGATTAIKTTGGASAVPLGIWNTASSGTIKLITFFYGGGISPGSITTDTLTTSYNTLSDYRLKTDIQPMTGALAKVAALKPVTYKWNSNGSDGEGFIAHELAEVCPQAVTGEKDAVDADGKPVYQGIDVSFLVGTLTAAIQELKAEFDAYKATHP